MAYTFSVNNTPANGAEAVFRLKAALVAAGWTVLSSSDGTTYNASGDQITVPASGAGSLNNTNAWFRVQMPSFMGATRELCFQRIGSSQSWRVKLSYAGFTGGTPGTVRVPSATDEQVLYGSGTDVSPIGNTWFNTDGTYRWNVCVGGASENYTLWAAAFPIGGGAVNSSFFIESLIANTFPVQDVDPLFYYIGGPGAAFNQTGGGIDRTLVGNGWYRRGLSNEAFVLMTSYSLVHEGSTLIQGALGTNPHNGKDDVLPMLWGRRGGATQAGYRGFGLMMRYFGVSRTAGETLSLSSTRDRIIYPPVVLPWDGSTPSV